MNTKKYINIGLIVLVYSAFAYIFWPFKQATIFALLFGFALNPILVRLKKLKKIKLTDFQAITILVFGLVGVLFLPLSYVIIRAIGVISKINTDQMMELPVIQKAHYFFTTVFDKLNSYALDAGLDLSNQIDFKSYAADIGKNVLAFATATVTNVPSGIFQFIIFIALLYYFLLNQSFLKNGLIKINLLNEAQILSLAGVFEKVCSLVLVSTLVIALLQATIVSFACLLVGFDGILIIFMIAFFMAFVPVVGSAPLTISLIGYSLLSGSYGVAIVLSIAAVFAATIDNVIKTYLFSSKKDSVSPLISLLSIIGSLTMLGPLGLFLGPVIAELAVQIGKIVSEE